MPLDEHMQGRKAGEPENPGDEQLVSPAVVFALTSLAVAGLLLGLWVYLAIAGS